MKVETCTGQYFQGPLKSAVNCCAVAAKGAAEDIAVHEISTAVHCAVPPRRTVLIHSYD